MFKVTMFRPVQFGQTATPIQKTVSGGPVRPSALLRELETDLFVRRQPVQPKTGEDTLTRLELEFGDLKPATLMVLDELKRMLPRLNMQEEAHARLSTMTVNGQDHILLEAAHDGIFDRLLKGLQELGAVRQNTPGTPEANPFRFADVSILLYERGLEDEQLPPPIGQIKKMRESLGRSSTPQTAAKALGEKLSEQGLGDLTVHPLELEPPAQLWVLYPSQRDTTREQAIAGTIANLPESEVIEGKPSFRYHGSLHPVVIAPDASRKAAETNTSAPNIGWLPKLNEWWRNLIGFFQSLGKQASAAN